MQHAKRIRVARLSMRIWFLCVSILPEISLKNNSGGKTNEES